MNSVHLIGRITSDLQTRKVGSAQDLTVLSFSVAYNERRGGQEEAHFFDVTAWNKQAETIAQYFKKGQRIGVSGRLRQERWKDESGNNRSRISIVLSEFEFIEPKANEGTGGLETGGSGGTGYRNAKETGSQGAGRSAANGKAAGEEVSFEEVSSDFLEDEVPF